MLSKFLTVALIVSFVSCKKEYRKSENSSVDTVKKLNTGDHQEIIDKLEGNKDLSGRERYYLASAYAMKGGVDIYSLYSVLEIQLFQKRAVDWSSLSKEKNPYLKFMKSQGGVDLKKRDELRLKRWEKLLPKIKKNKNIHDIPTYEEVVGNEYCYCQEFTLEEFNELKSRLDKILSDFNSKNHTVDDFNESWYQIVFSDQAPAYDYENQNPSRVYYYLVDFYTDQAYLEVLKKNYISPKPTSDTPFSNVPWEMVYMNILWNTYEAIPVLKKLPTFSNDQQDQISKAMEHFYKLMKDPEFKSVSLKNITILSALSLLSIYKQSFDLNTITSTQDLYCSFEPSIILDNYKLIRDRLLFIQKAFQNSGIKSKEYKKYKAQIEMFKKTIPPDLTTEEKDSFYDSVEDFKVDSCFNG